MVLYVHCTVKNKEGSAVQWSPEPAKDRGFLQGPVTVTGSLWNYVTGKLEKYVKLRWYGVTI